MKKINGLENIDKSKGLKEQGINGTLLWAYRNSMEAGNDLIDFGEVIWDYDIDEIIENCKAFGITEFTISSTFSSLIKTLAEFEEKGCKMAGLTKVNARYTDIATGERALIPAIKMTL